MTRADRQRREEIIKRHAPLVKVIAGRIAGHLPRWVEREDLVSAGVLGLLKALDRYDPARGVKFETYATPVIRGEIMEALRAKDWVPRSVRRKARELAVAVGGLEGQLGRPPTSGEVAEYMGLTTGEYEAILADTSRASLLSFEEVFVEGEDMPGINGASANGEDLADPLAAIESQEMTRVVAQAVERLPEREKQVLGLYYQEGLTLKEIGAILGVTESRICQIHSQAMARVRAAVIRETEA
jgi:RNA polymerase sigma factor for flagellar operon FliA